MTSERQRLGCPRGVEFGGLDDTELTILEDSSFVGKSVREVEELEGEHHLVVTGWLRHGRTRRRPFGDEPIRAGDVLLVRASPDEILAIRQDRRCPCLVVLVVQRQQEGWPRSPPEKAVALEPAPSAEAAGPRHTFLALYEQVPPEQARVFDRILGTLRPRGGSAVEE